MRKIVHSSQFKKDYKRITKRGYNLEKLIATVAMLANDQVLPKRYKPHKLSGAYKNFCECHIEPDWLLVYEYAGHELHLRRTGTHADLFN